MTEEQFALFGFLFVETGAASALGSDTSLLESRLQMIADMLTDEGRKVLLGTLRLKVQLSLEDKKSKLEAEILNVDAQLVAIGKV